MNFWKTMVLGLGIFLTAAVSAFSAPGNGAAEPLDKHAISTPLAEGCSRSVSAVNRPELWTLSKTATEAANPEAVRLQKSLEAYDKLTSETRIREARHVNWVKTCQQRILMSRTLMASA